MSLSDLETTGTFPEEIEKFKKVINDVENFNAVRMNITGDIAESIVNVKNFVVKAEDARIINEMYYILFIIYFRINK
jgi:hypothetical protein